MFSRQEDPTQVHSPVFNISPDIHPGDTPNTTQYRSDRNFGSEDLHKLFIWLWLWNYSNLITFFIVAPLSIVDGEVGSLGSNRGAWVCGDVKMVRAVLPISLILPISDTQYGVLARFSGITVASVSDVYSCTR